MSTYGGFSNRHQEMLYGKLNESLVLLMSHHIIQVLNEAPVNLKEFTERLIIIYSQMMKLESSKYYPPRISEYFQDLTLLCASREGVNAPNFDVTTESPSKSDLECPAVDRRSIAVQQAPRVLSDKQINSRSFSQSRFSEKESIVDSPHRTYKG